MNKKPKVWVGVLCVLLATGAMRASAQEQAFNLTLLKTFVRTENNTLNLSQSGTQAFLPTTVNCPTTAKKGCVLKIEVSSEFSNMNQNGASITVTVSDGSGLPGIDPNASIPSCNECGADNRTFQWMQRSLPARTKATVKVEFSQIDNQGQASNRTETIELFKN